MSGDRGAKANRRGEPRVPFDGAVRLRYRLFHEFLEENAANISTGGMFIRTIHPGEPGSELDFEIRLDDDFTLIQGRGEVAWVKRQGPDPGMGIRFLELPDECRALVERIVSERTEAGLELFDLESGSAEPVAEAAPPRAGRAKVAGPVDDAPIWELGGEEAVATAATATSAEEAAPAAPRPPAVGETPAGPAVDERAPAVDENLAALDPELPPRRSEPAADGSPSRRQAIGGRGRSSPLRLTALAVISALVGAGAVLAFYWFHVQPSIDALETRIEELAGDPGGPWSPPAEEPAAAVDDGAAGEAPAAVAPGAAASQSDEVVDTLRAWAAAWEEARRARIARPQWIRVALTLVQVEPTGPDGAEVRFVQSYRSERYKDLVRKRMTMVRENGAWKIAAEQSTPG